MSTLQKIKSLITLKAKEASIDPNILHALVMTESGHNPWAIRFEVDYRWLYDVPGMAKAAGVDPLTMKIMQQTSWGICQIMGAIAYEYGFRGWAPMLCDPELNLKYAILHLQKKIKHEHLSDPCDIYGSYNAGSVRKKNGEYVNKKYVDRFRLNLNKITLPDN
jgi:hypothetical protein